MFFSFSFIQAQAVARYCGFNKYDIINIIASSDCAPMVQHASYKTLVLSQHFSRPDPLRQNKGLY